MMMSSISLFQDSVFFGVLISLASYGIGQEYKEKKQHSKYNALQKELDGFKTEGMTTQRKHNADKQVRQLEYMLNK